MSESDNILYMAAAIEVKTGTLVCSNLHPDGPALLADFNEKMQPGISGKLFSLGGDPETLYREAKEWIAGIADNAQMQKAFMAAFLRGMRAAASDVFKDFKELDRANTPWVGVAIDLSAATLLVSTFSFDKEPASAALKEFRLWLAENGIYGAEMTPLIDLFVNAMITASGNPDLHSGEMIPVKATPVNRG